jgi:hypothetical protein
MAYNIVGYTTKITATSRAAVKVRDNYFTVEATEERTLPDSGADISKEWDALFDSVNSVIDNQVQDIMDANKK